MTEKPVLPDPMAAARRPARAELPKRFYTEATAAPGEGGFVILLDGRPVRTPAKRLLAVAARPVAVALAAEWQAQGERIDPGAMPLTRIANAAIDRVAEEIAAVRADIVAFAGSDLVCYRADGPEDLIAAEERAWSPLVVWAREALGVRLILAEGVVPVRQHAEAPAAVDRALQPFGSLGLAALHVVTTLTGSAVIALAVAMGRLSAEAGWIVAHVDEDWQASRWGIDEAAAQRRAARWTEMEAASLILAAVRADAAQ